MKKITSIILSCLFLASCNSNEIGNARDVNPDAIYFDYKVSAEEGSEEVTVLLQYRFGGSRGTTLVLEEPAGVELDGVKITTDSSKLTGAYYEVRSLADSFTGKHLIVYTDKNKKQYREEFLFRPVSFVTQLPATVPRADLEFELAGLDPIDYVRVVLTDTSYASAGINRVDTVRNGRLRITTEDFRAVVNGPIEMELIREGERPVKNGSPEGGSLSVSYKLRRSFTLN